ncbi:MAG: Ni/Fe hydrogenase subunit alpha [Thermoguttaceae bacterium]
MSNVKKSGTPSVRTISVKALARVEGEGALNLTMRNGKVEDLQFKIFEPPRFYEAFLRGRGFEEVPDITARICGICPVAYQMGSCHALEKAMGVFDQIDPGIRVLRNLLYCGEWIESHVLHMFMLHLPDFLGYESAISMAEDHGPVVKRSLRVKKAGNDIVCLLGGRAVHPVGACVGGFHRVPALNEMAGLLGEIKFCLDEMCDLTLTLSKIVKFPELERDYEFVSLCPDNEYPMNLGRIKSNKGLDVDQQEFGAVADEYQSPHSTALHARLKDRGPYVVGPLSRLNLNADKLHPRAAEILESVCKTLGKPLPWRNSFLNLMARGVETIHALALAADIMQNYTVPKRSRIPIIPRSGVGGHGTEAPRGLCWHEYRTEADGTISSARIMPPTSQNQPTIEADLRELAEKIAALSDEEMTLQCEHLIRNYDPCISCSTHFLKLNRKQAE